MLPSYCESWLRHDVGGVCALDPMENIIEEETLVEGNSLKTISLCFYYTEPIDVQAGENVAFTENPHHK